MHKDIEARVLKAIGERVFPGCVIGVVRKKGEREVWPFGHFTYDADSQKVAEDTIYDIASITKSIPTASLALVLIDDGRLRLSDKLIEYIPEFANKWREEVTIEQLMRYEIHGLQLSTLKDKTPEEILQSAYSCELDDKPGTKHVYTNLPALLLGIVVERVNGDTLDKLAQKYFFDPLTMNRTSYFSHERLTKSFIAPTEIENGKELRGIVQDESARAFAKAGRAVGHAGLFSTAPDILNFLEALLQGRYPNVVDGAQRGLGWQAGDTRFMGKYAGPHTFGKTGFTGTSIVCDTERGIAFVILSNRTYPKRPPNDDAIYDFRRDIADIILGSR